MSSQPFIAPTQEPKTYTGCCHCQALVYTVKLDNLDSVLGCNCSICASQSILWVFPELEDIKIQRNGSLAKYEFASKAYFYEVSIASAGSTNPWSLKTADAGALQFCSICGNTFGAKGKENGFVGLNARLLQDVDIWGLKIDPVLDGASHPPLYEVPEFQGPPFQHPAQEGRNNYYGNCHCGAVTLAMESDPLENSDTLIYECNCSFCWRSGRIHCYPKNAEDIHLGGAEHLTMYPYKPTARAYFCNKCGTHLLMDDSDPVELKVGLGHDMNVTAVTLRILQGLDLAKVNVNQYNGRDNAPIYVVK